MTEAVVVLLILAVVMLVGFGVFGLAVSHLVHEISGLVDSLGAPQ